MKNSGYFTTERVLGEKNNKWKGNQVGYNGLHSWVKRILGKAERCVDCSSINWVQWANISGNYKRDLTDWKQLCSVCHRRFDGITKLSKEEAILIRTRYVNGEKQTNLAKEYAVDQGTISNIVRNKIQYYA